MLQTALPSPLQTVAVDVCLNADDRAFENWGRVIGTQADARVLLGKSEARLRRLVSLLYMRFRERDTPMDKSLLTWFRTATVREQLRAESVGEICATAFAVLSAERVSAIVVNGVAMASAAYPQTWARHCHDLDLLFEPGKARVAVDALLAAGFSRAAPRARASASTAWLSHSSGFGVALHQVPYRVHAWNSDASVLHMRAVGRTIAGHDVRVFDDEDALVRIICNGLSAGSRHSPCWAVDAGLLVNESGRRPDWNRVVAVARSADRSEAVLTGLDYMKRALRVNVPDGAIEALRVAGSTESTIRSSVEAARLSAYGSRLGLIRRSRRTDILRTATWALGSKAEPT